MASEVDETVCVIGASGFIGSWIVRFLLQRGYRVRGTVEDLGDDRETKHLMSFEGADDRLELFQADLFDYEALATAIGKSNGVFHVASPCPLEQPKDPQVSFPRALQALMTKEVEASAAAPRELIDPAVQGTMNVLKASHAAGVRRVVVTSSIAALFPNPKLPPGTAVDEDSWADIEYCKERGAWYRVSKVLAEKAAWKFAGETGLDMVVINPGCALGKSLQPRLNASSGVLLNLIQGVPQELTWLGTVHVQDVARAHILLYETPAAKGRHLCTDEIIHFNHLAEDVAQLFPQYNVCRFKEETHPGRKHLGNPSNKLTSLGFTFTSREEAIKDAVLSLQEKGFLPA